MLSSKLLLARSARVHTDFVSVTPLTTKVALLNGPCWRYRVSRMKTSSIHEAVSNPTQRYPRGRWTGPADRAMASEQHLGALFRELNGDDSALLHDATERRNAMLEAIAARPPFMTAMDCPMTDAA